jgi:RNA polymerase-interacting CarD/CdnL/TRCF family regulator
MPTDKNTSPIGKKVISTDFGIGNIVGVEKLQEGGDDYYVIEYGSKNVKSYFPISGNKKIRFLTTQDEFMKEVKKLKSEKTVLEIQSKKDRHAYFNSVLHDSNLDQVVTKILEISSLSDLIPGEKDKFNKLVNTLELEAAIIYELTSPKSQEFIADYLNNKSKALISKKK